MTGDLRNKPSLQDSWIPDRNFSPHHKPLCHTLRPTVWTHCQDNFIPFLENLSCQMAEASDSKYGTGIMPKAQQPDLSQILGRGG